MREEYARGSDRAAPASGTDAAAAALQYQRKITPAGQSSRIEDPWLAVTGAAALAQPGPDTFEAGVLASAVRDAARAGAAARQELIVVASLVDRLPNLAGLARTCEVFRCVGRGPEICVCARGEVVLPWPLPLGSLMVSLRRRGAGQRPGPWRRQTADRTGPTHGVPGTTDKTPCRAAQLVVSDASVVKEPQFQSISVSANLWMPIREVPGPQAGLDWIWGKRREEGEEDGS